MAKISGIAAAAALVLSGCGVVHPGAAAVAGSDTITDSQVDDVALALCSANTANGGQAVPSRGARQGALSVLLRSAISRQFGADEGVQPDQRQVSQALSQNDAAISALPASQRDDFRKALREYAEGQLMVIAVGKRVLKQQGQAKGTNDQALAEGNKLRTKFADSLDVEVDPRYGTFVDGDLKPGGGSLSVAVSSHATDGTKADPSAPWVAALPAAQKCS